MKKIRSIIDNHFSFIAGLFIVFIVFMSIYGINQYFKNSIVGMFEAETILYNNNKEIFYDQRRIMSLRPKVVFKRNGDLIFISPNDTIKHYNWYNRFNKLYLIHNEFHDKFDISPMKLDFSISSEGGITISEYRIYLKPIKE